MPTGVGLEVKDDPRDARGKIFLLYADAEGSTKIKKGGKKNENLQSSSCAGLVDTLKGKGPLTVFAPTDEAFAKLPAGTVEDLLKPENRAKLQAILTYHVVPGQVTASEVVKLQSAPTANGRALKIETADGKVMVDNATVVQADIMASNGVIHVIDTVVLP